jgi:hypothetical protein
MRSLMRIAGFAGFIACALLAASVGWHAAFTPLNYSSRDPFWFWAFATACAAVPLLACIRRGRLLMVLSLSALALFILSTVVRGGTGWALLMLTWILLVAAGLGDRFLSIAAPSLSASMLERAALATMCGLGLLAMLMLLCGWLNLYYRPAAFGLLLTLTVFLLPSLLRWVHAAGAAALPRAVRKWHTSDLRLTAIIMAGAAICLWGGLVWALVPSIQFDTLVYHLGVPAIYVQQHGLVEVTEEFRSYWAHNGEMLYTLGLLLSGQPLPALLHLSCGLLTAGWLALVGRRIGGARLGMMAAILFYSVPLVTLQSECAYVDLFATLFASGALGSAAIWWIEQDNRWLMVTGILAGFAAGTKLNAAYVLLPLALAILCGLFLRCRMRRTFFIGLLYAGIPLLLFWAPWLMRDWAWTGNPIFPFYNRVFQSNKWPLENTLFDFGGFGAGRGIVEFVRLPWDLVVRGELFLETGMGVMGGLSLLALPWGYFAGSPALRRWMRVFSIFALTALAAWFQVGPYARYLLPLLPALALLSAMNFESLCSWVATRSWRTAAGVLLLSVAFAYLAATRWVVTRSNWQIPERYPYDVALGWTSPQAFLSRAVDAYDAFQFLNTKGHPEVLSIGNDYRLYTNARIIPVGAQVEPRGKIPPIAAGPGLAHELQHRKFDYVLINQNAIRLSPQEYSGIGIHDPSFLARYAQLAFSGQGVLVYLLRDFSAEPLRPEDRNYLRNGGFEEQDSKGNAPGWIAHGKPLIDRTGAYAHSGQAAVQVNAASNLYQLLAVSSGTTYTIGHWTRAHVSGQFARLQINWLDDNLKIIDASIDVVPVEAEWTWHQMSVRAPLGATLAQVYASVHQNGLVWFDDFQFVPAEVK